MNKRIKKKIQKRLNCKRYSDYRLIKSLMISAYNGIGMDVETVMKSNPGLFFHKLSIPLPTFQVYRSIRRKWNE